MELAHEVKLSLHAYLVRDHFGTHEIQLSAYAHLVRKTLGCHESQLEIRSLVKTKVPKVETQTYARRSDKHFERLFAVIREYLQALENGVYNYRPSWTCNMCDFLETHCQNACS